MLEKFADNTLFLDGKNLLGDDFNAHEIEQWYKEEEEAYYNLTEKHEDSYIHENAYNSYGFKNELAKLKMKKDIRILCFGAAYGGEVQSIIKILKDENIEQYTITVIDSSLEMLTMVKEKLKVDIMKSNINGRIDSNDSSYDFITCFGVLHHIPNVSYVVSEFYRILKPTGLLIIREPISSMGIWGSKRIGVTVNERGLGIEYINNLVNKNNFQLILKKYVFFYPMLRVVNLFGLDIDNKIIIALDSFLCTIFSWNITYNRNSLFKKFAPGSIYLVLKK